MRSERLKVAHLTECPIGGVLTHLEELIIEQIRDPDVQSIEILSPEVNWGAFRHLQHPKLTVRSYGSRIRSLLGLVSLTTNAWRLVSHFEPDVVHLHSTIAGAIVRPLLFAGSDRPSIIYCPHGWVTLRTRALFSERYTRL